MLQEELNSSECHDEKNGQLHCFLSGPLCVFAFMFSLVDFHLLANNCTIEMYCILGGD